MISGIEISLPTGVKNNYSIRNDCPVAGSAPLPRIQQALDRARALPFLQSATASAASLKAKPAAGTAARPTAGAAAPAARPAARAAPAATATAAAKPAARAAPTARPAASLRAPPTSIAAVPSEFGVAIVYLVRLLVILIDALLRGDVWV